MLILGVETSSPRGSVALIEDGASLLELSHEVPNAHAEQLILLVEQLFVATQRSRAEVRRVAVGVGPGSFTGLRVGIALAQGIALGLGVPLFGVPSLRSLTHGAMALSPAGSLLCPLLDARRGEAFIAAYDAQLREVLPVQTLATEEVIEQLSSQLGTRPFRLCGEFAGQLAPQLALKGPGIAQFPTATSCAQLARDYADADEAPVVPLYVRPPDAILPKLPPNPLAPRT